MYGELPSPCSGPKPNMGYGRRIDLATINRQSNIPDYNYDYDNMDGTIKKLTNEKVKKGSRCQRQFGSSHSQHERAVVPTAMQHYLGKGTKEHNGLSIE
jgi:hypothetical protein